MSWRLSMDWRLRGARRGMTRRPVRHDPTAGRWIGTMSGCSSPLRGRVDARRRAGARAEPTDHRPPIGRVRGHFWRAGLVRPPARGAAPQRRRRAAGPGRREHRGCGANVGAAECGCLAGVERHRAGIDRRVRRRLSGSLPVGSDNDGAAVRHHVGTGRRVAPDGEPRATPSRYGAAPRAAGRRRLLHLQGWHLRLRGLPAARRGCRWVGHLYRRASALCACALGPAADRRDRKSGGAARLIDADAFGSDPRRYRPRRTALLCRRRPSSASNG